MSEKDENIKEENEKNMDCWDGCYDEKTQWAMKMQSKIIDGVEYNYCPKCNRAWPLDWDQYRVCPHEVMQRSLNHHFKMKEQNPQDYWPDDDIQGGN
jgi:Zn-finger nucleic acid-binding protein